MAHADFLIAGAGVIGLSIALELDRRGASVVVLDSGRAARQTSAAAAGTLAVEDRHNPAALHALSARSALLYTDYLARISVAAGERVDFQTSASLEECDADSPFALADPREVVPQLAAVVPPFRLLDERSVDPRQLGEALRSAVLHTRIDLREHTALERVQMLGSTVRVETSAGAMEAKTVIDCMGSWSPAQVAPRRGQMLSVLAPEGFNLRHPVRGQQVYIVPRTQGPDRGKLIIGSTMEDAGFDVSVKAQTIVDLNARAVRMMPALAEAKFVESWAGLRPYTADLLPILGALEAQPRYILATGHFRNGILLAPVTAEVIGQLVSGETPSIDLSPFSPGRFSAVGKA